MSLTEAKLSSLRDKHSEREEAEEALKIKDTPKAKAVKKEKVGLGGKKGKGK